MELEVVKESKTVKIVVIFKKRFKFILKIVKKVIQKLVCKVRVRVMNWVADKSAEQIN